MPGILRIATYTTAREVLPFPRSSFEEANHRRQHSQPFIKTRGLLQAKPRGKDCTHI